MKVGDEVLVKRYRENEFKKAIFQTSALHGSYVVTRNKDQIFDGAIERLCSIDGDMRDVEEGDIISNGSGAKRLVLGVCGEVVFLSYDDKTNFCNDSNYTIQQLKNIGYKIQHPMKKEQVEYTKKEIAEKLGIEESNLTIKDCVRISDVPF